MATIITPERKIKKVKNLGWFFRKARSETIRDFTMIKIEGPGSSLSAGWHMRVVFDDAYVFEAEYADLSVFKNVMNRQRSLKGVRVHIDDGKRTFDYVLGSQGGIDVGSTKMKSPHDRV